MIIVQEAIHSAKEAAQQVIDKKGYVNLEKQAVNKINEASESNVDEIPNKALENIENAGDGVKLKLDEIKNMTPEQLNARMEQKSACIEDNLKHSRNETTGENEVAKEELTSEEKIKIKEESGWSDELIDTIGSQKEYEIYKNADLVEAKIGDKNCLIREDIDWDQKDEMGRTNRERAEQGLSPINKSGNVIELHHIGQHADSPLAELTQAEHRGKGNDTILHDKTKDTEINRQVFAGERSEHWEKRAQEG